MAITYHAGRRIQGLERVGSTITFEDDFTSYATQGDADTAYPTNDTADFRVNIANDNLAFDSKVTSTTNTGIYHDLGTALSDSAWVMDFKMVLSTLTLYSGGSIGAATYFTMNDSASGGAIGASVDAIGFYMSSSSSGSKFVMTYGDSSALNTSVGILTTANSTGTRYFRIIRLSTTSMRLEIYSDSARTSLIEGKTSTSIPSTVTGLRYFRIQDNQSGAGTGTGQQVGTIDDIKIYDGSTSVVALAGDVKPTNVQVGSRFEETDTRKMYHRDDIDFKEENGNEATNYRSASWYEQLSGETP